MQPNIVLFVTDDQPYSTLPSLSAAIPMPYLQSRMQNPDDHWIRFTNAFLNTPICCPTRATLLTGRYSHRTGVETNGQGSLLDASSTTATQLHDAGYHTGLVGKYINRYPFDRPYFIPPGWDRWAANFEEYYNYTNYEDGAVVAYGAAAADYSTDVIARRAVEFIRDAPEDRPFFLYAAPKAAHDPWIPAPRHAGEFSGMDPLRFPNFNEVDVTDKPAWVRKRPPLDAAGVAEQDRRRRLAYETLRSADDAVRSILEALTERGVLDQTVFIFMSDNGFAFGEHRWTTKKCEYDECTRTPFLVRFPGAAGRSQDELVSSVDVAVTLAELAGTVPPGITDGRSIVPLLDGTATSWRSVVLLHGIDDGYGTPGYWAVHTRDHLYVEFTTGEQELYDLTGTDGPADPYELDNRISHPAYQALRPQLGATLRELRAENAPNVEVSDAGFAPVSLRINDGETVQWTFAGPGDHSVTDASGMGLFASGDRRPGSTFSFAFSAAGAYSYRCAVDGNHTGTIRAAPVAAPTSGGTTRTRFWITWAAGVPPPGYVFDVQLKRAGSTAFTAWRTGTTAGSAAFTPDAGKGTYTFRARLRNPRVSRSSGWSPPIAVTAR